MKKKNILITIVALILLISVIAVTYAYYIIGVSNANKQTANLTTGTMSLTFSDNDNGFGGTINFGDTITKKFTIKNTGTLDASAQMNWVNIINTYLDGSLKYTLEWSETLNGTYTPIISNKNVPRSTSKSTKVLAPKITVPATKTYYYNLKVTLVATEEDQTADLDASFFSQFSLSKIEKKSASEETLTALFLDKNNEAVDLTKVATMNETADGLYSMEDDYGTSYYFRGATENNYVKFGKWSNSTKVVYYGNVMGTIREFSTLSECKTSSSSCESVARANKDMYWRIIRINGNGSLRMIYDGTVPHANGESSLDRAIGESSFNANSDVDSDDNAYIGYMYGQTNATTYEKTHENKNDSSVKQYLDKWYENNFLGSDYEKYISDEIFCNDRSLDTSNSDYTGIGTTTAYYGATKRFDGRTNNPNLLCSQKHDAFTKGDITHGNGILKYSIGLITADEISLAGAFYNEANTNFYLYKGIQIMSLSPANFVGNSYLYYLSNDGSLYNTAVRNNLKISPVINLSPEAAKQLIGTGISTDPYRLPE